MKYSFFVFLFSLVGCSSAPQAELSDKAAELEVFGTKPTDCKVVGKVVGKNSEGSKDLALNHALNQAADKNATGIFVNQEVPNGSLISVFATAYKCD